MAVDMFLKLTGLEGEARDAAHKGEIDVLSWSWGVNQAGYAHVGGGVGSGKVSVQDLSLVKYTDKSSPDLMLSCCNGKHYPEGQLTVRKAGEKPLEYLIIKMTDVMITSYQPGGQSAGDRVTESLSLNFSKVVVEYTEQTQTGAPGAKPKAGWDVAANKKI